MEKMVEKKRVAVVGAGVSGLAVCKYALQLGFDSIVFEADAQLGGVWAHALGSTVTQTPNFMYRYSDFPWPEAAPEFPAATQVTEYLHSYARRFGVLGRIKFGHRVIALDYVSRSGEEEAAAAEEVIMAWEQWAGNGEAFGGGAGEWLVTVQSEQSPVPEIYRFDFVVLCVGRFSGLPNMPAFEGENKGPEVFDGEVMHSMDYSKMGQTKAAEMIKGKRVVVIGGLKSALDIAAECANVNGPSNACTVIVRRKHWHVASWNTWGIHLALLYLNRFAELLIHKPGEGPLLSMIATVFSPLRWLVCKFTESYHAIPLKKRGMKPDHSFSYAIDSSKVAITPPGFFDLVDNGSIVVRESKTFTFCSKGVILQTGETADHPMNVECDVVIFATGFKGDQKLVNIFKSPLLRNIVAGSSTTTVPLYRECIHPRIPQLAIIGYSESLSNMYTSEMRSKWLACFMRGVFRLPSIRLMEEEIARWEAYMKRYSGDQFRRSSISTIHTWYNDQLCMDMGVNPKRKKGLLADLFIPYTPDDYAGIEEPKD